MNLFNLFRKNRSTTPPRDEAPAPATPGTLPYSIGDVIDGEFRVRKILGRGGFGVVYLVESIDKSDFYALKMLLEAGRRESKDDANFAKEARVGLELGQHPFVVQTLQVRNIKGRTAVVMEYIPPTEDGRITLLDYIKRGPDFTDRQIGNWVVEFCVAMEYAVSKGVIAHRDIKPENLLVDTIGFLKVSDFGIAWAIDGIANESQSNGIRDLRKVQTIDGRITCGTPGYIAPELLSGGKASTVSDMFSFGVTLWQLVTRSTKLPYRVAFQGDIDRFMYDLLEKQLRGELIATSSIFHSIIARCLHPQHEKRFSSFQELREETKRVLKSAGLGAIDFIVNPQMRVTFGQLINKATSLSVLGSSTKALTLLDQAIEQAPESAIAFKARGGAYLRMGNDQAAISDFERALFIEPGDKFAQVGLATVLARVGRTSDALDILDHIIQREPRWVRALRSRAKIYMRNGRLTEAKADIRLAYEIDPTDLYVCKQFGDILCAAKDYVGGLAKYDAAITADPLFLAPRLGKANLLMLTSAVDGIEEFRRAVKVFAQDHSALNEVAVAMATNGAAHQAIGIFEQLLVLEPQDRAVFLCNIGNAYRELSETTQARAYYDRSIQADPTYALAYRRAADCLRSESQYESALEMYERALALESPNYFVLEGAGTVSLILGNALNAERHLAKAVQMQEVEPGTWCNLAMSRAQLRDLRGGIEATDGAIRARPDYAKAWLLRAAFLKEQNRLKEALDAAVQACTHSTQLQGHEVLGARKLRDELSVLIKS